MIYWTLSCAVIYWPECHFFLMKLDFLMVILKGRTLSIIPMYLTGSLQSELKFS